MDERLLNPLDLSHVTYSSDKEPIKSVWEVKDKFGRGLGEPSVYHIYVDQSDLLQLV